MGPKVQKCADVSSIWMDPYMHPNFVEMYLQILGRLVWNKCFIKSVENSGPYIFLHNPTETNSSHCEVHGKLFSQIGVVI